MGEIIFGSEGSPSKENYGVKLLVPNISLSLEAYQDIRSFIKHVPGGNEISWFGFVETVSDEKTLNHHIYKVFLVEQEVSGASTDMTTNGLSKLYHELMQTPEGEALAGQIKYWGHLHPWEHKGETGINGSSTDETEFLKFGENGNDFFIRAIYSKNMKASYCYLDYLNKVRYNNLPFSLKLPDNTEERDSQIKAEIAEKVKVPVYRGYTFNDENDFSDFRFGRNYGFASWGGRGFEPGKLPKESLQKYADLFVERYF